MDATADALLALMGVETEDEDDQAVGAYLLAEALRKFLGWCD